MFDFLFGFGRHKIKDALRQGATIVDVRTVHEYDQGRLRGSINIPLDRIPASTERIRQMKKPVIFCAAGDGRSGNAANFIKREGIKEVYNGGNWEKLLQMINNL
ncbi:MAG TPA: rhodanese-like domain-containing protein [Chitinophagaceae bacterium]